MNYYRFIDNYNSTLIHYCYVSIERPPLAQISYVSVSSFYFSMSGSNPLPLSPGASNITYYPLVIAGGTFTGHTTTPLNPLTVQYVALPSYDLFPTVATTLVGWPTVFYLTPTMPLDLLTPTVSFYMSVKKQSGSYFGCWDIGIEWQYPTAVE